MIVLRRIDSLIRVPKTNLLNTQPYFGSAKRYSSGLAVLSVLALGAGTHLTLAGLSDVHPQGFILGLLLVAGGLSGLVAVTKEEEQKTINQFNLLLCAEPYDGEAVIKFCMNVDTRSIYHRTILLNGILQSLSSENWCGAHDILQSLSGKPLILDLETRGRCLLAIREAAAHTPDINKLGLEGLFEEKTQSNVPRSSTTVLGMKHVPVGSGLEEGPEPS